jgi:hypothetical protein
MKMGIHDHPLASSLQQADLIFFGPVNFPMIAYEFEASCKFVES